MRPPRFRLRTLMVAVAVASAALGAEALRRRAARPRRLAADPAAEGRMHARSVAIATAEAEDLRGAG